MENDFTEETPITVATAETPSDQGLTRSKKWVAPAAAVIALALGIGIGTLIWLPGKNAAEAAVTEAQSEAKDLQTQIATVRSEVTTLEGKNSELQEKLDAPRTLDPMKACEITVGDLKDQGMFAKIPTTLQKIGAVASDKDTAMMALIHLQLEEAEDLAPAELRAAIMDVHVPFQQFWDAVNAATEDTSLRLDTSRMLEKTTRVMEACVDEGYRIK